MPTAFAENVISFAGESKGERDYVEQIDLDTATTVAAPVISKVEFWRDPPTSNVLSLHPAAIWRSLCIDVVPGPGTFGRAVTLHCGWRAEGEHAPTTFAEMRSLFGYRIHVYGGAADPGSADRKMAAVFNGSRSDVLKTRSFTTGGRMIFYYAFTEASFGTTQVSGARFFLLCEGIYEVFGSI